MEKLIGNFETILTNKTNHLLIISNSITMLKNFFFFKKYKLNQLKKIQKTFKYIYFFRYNDLNIKEIIILKKLIKKLNYKSLIVTQKLTTQIFLKLKGPNSILLIYGNQDLNLINNLKIFKKLHLIYLIAHNTIFSALKIKTITNKNSFSLNNSMVYPFLNFIYYLRKI